MAITFPRNNLPNAAVPWGRTIEEAVVSQDRAIDNALTDTQSDNRAMAGQLGILGRQLNELQARSVVQLEVSDLSISRPSGSGWANTSRNFTIPGVGDESRWAYVSFSTVLDNPSVLNYMQVGVSLTAGGEVVGRQEIPRAGTQYMPSWYPPSASFGSLVSIPANGRTFTVTLDAQTLSGGSSRTARITDIQVTVMYSDKE